MGGTHIGFMRDPLINKIMMASARGPNKASETSRRELTGSSRAQPLPWSFLREGRPNLWSKVLPGVADVAVFLASTLAFHLMLRVSEYTAKAIDGSNSTHALKGEDVLVSFRRVTGEQVTRVMDATSWAGDENVEVIGITIILRSSKTFSVHDESSRHYLDATVSVELNELVTGLLWWIENTKPKAQAIFFSYPCYVDQRRALTDRDVSKFVKRLARNHGFQDRGFSPHSLRVGGASSMSCEGIELETINQSGRWAANSQAAIKYRNPSIKTAGALSKNSEGTSILLERDILRLNETTKNTKRDGIATMRD
jgi:hypothetical protein